MYHIILELMLVVSPDDNCLEKLQRMIGFRNVAQDQEHVVCLLHVCI